MVHSFQEIIVDFLIIEKTKKQKEIIENPLKNKINNKKKRYAYFSPLRIFIHLKPLRTISFSKPPLMMGAIRVKRVFSH